MREPTNHYFQKSKENKELLKSLKDVRKKNSSNTQN